MDMKNVFGAKGPLGPKKAAGKRDTLGAKHAPNAKGAYCMKSVFGVVLSLALAFGFVPSQGVASAWAAGDGEGQASSLVASVNGGVSSASQEAAGASQGGSQEASAASAQADTQANSSWRDNIDALLDAGSYAEGEVVIVAPVEADTEDAMHGALGADSSVERIYETDGAVFEEASGESIPKDVLADAQKDDGAVSAGDVEIATFLLRAPSLTTRQLLEALSKETCVLDASPNYLYSIDDDAFGQDDEADDDDADTSGDADEADDEVDEANGADNAESADESEEATIDAGGADSANADAESNASEGSLVETPEADGADAAALSVASNDSAIATYAVASSSFVPNAAKDVTASADATSWQWALNRGTLPFKTARDGNAVVSDSTWNTGTANATGVVAVFDTGVDYTHPDLQNAMMDMSPYVGKIGGTSHGYNAVNEKAEPLDDVGHGTHVAGIIAASTNDFGVSGAANGVKLLPVKASDGNGNFSSASIQRGYAYLKKAIQAGVDVRVVNDSWAGNGAKIDSMVNYAVTDLGASGAVSVFASGNSGANIDNTTWTAVGLQYNQYVVVADSLDMNALASAFSNYGAGTTDVFAPGSTILSTTRTDQPGKYNAAAMRSGSSTFVTFEDASDAVAVTSDQGKSLGAYDANSGFDKEGGCVTVSGKELTSLKPPSSTETKAKKRVWLNVPVDESKLSEASMVGCAVRFTGKLGADAWLEVQDSDGNALSGSNETEVVDNGNWQTLSLDLSKACAAHNRSIGVFRDASGKKAYIKVAVCLKATRLQASTASLSIDCVGVGSQSWHYGFMSGTSMAAPLVSAYAAVLASKIPNYSSLEVTARACKVANLVCTSAKKLDKLNGLCSTGGVVNPSAFAKAIAADTNTPYLGDVIFEESADGTYMTVTMVGIGFGQQQGSIIVKAFDDSGLKYTIVSWSDTKIVYTMPISKRGSSKVTTTVENASGNKTAASTSSILSGDESDEPDQPEEPSKPATPGDASGSGSGGAASSGSAGGSGSGASGAAGAGNANATQPVLGSSGFAQGNDASVGAFAETGDTASLWTMIFLLGTFTASGALVLATRGCRRL